MTKNKRNYNQDYFKVGGSPQPGEQEMPEQSKERMARSRKEERRRKVPPGAPGTEPEETGGE
jgi:hypothetical protein